MSDSATPLIYRAEDRAILLRVYQRLLWDRLLGVLPPSLKPNTITLVGESCALLAPVAAFFATRGIPSLYLLSALLLFVYVTGDNIDGQHARRTAQTSALGEFLDHGLDGLASCAVLLSSAFALGISGWALAVLVALGSLGFGSVFWAQYRTGILVTPRVSAMEGVTGASLFQLMMFVLRQPSWLRFTPGRFNCAAGLVIVLVLCYVYATLSPIVRARRVGAKMGELVVPLVVALIAVGGAALGVDGLAAALTVALVVAAMVCRMILLRARGETRTFVSPLHVLPSAALVIAQLDIHRAGLWAWAGVGTAFAIYIDVFVAGVRQMRRSA
jgi:phosphatidylglycerophosphate synthase